MIVCVLGSAAGGGFPQWNCNLSLLFILPAAEILEFLTDVSWSADAHANG